MSLVPMRSAASNLPALVATSGEQAARRFFDFFTSNIRNRHTREAYGRAVNGFLLWCEVHGVRSLADVQPLHVAAWIEAQTLQASVPTVKQRLATIRHFFDWLVVGQIVPVNPAASVRGPKHIVRKGKTPVLEPIEACALLDSIDTATPVGLRDRALIGLMVYSFARIGAALGMKIEDVYRRAAAALGAAAREGRQASRNALPSQPRNVPDGVYREDGDHGRRHPRKSRFYG